MEQNWHTLKIITQLKHSDVFEQALEPFCHSVNTSYTPTSTPNDDIEILGYSDNEFPEDNIHQAIKFFADEFNINMPKISYAIQENKNWVEENLQQFPPLKTSGFYIYGSHIAHDSAHKKELESLSDHIKLQIDASIAFGTGEHPTTKGCLQALRYLEENNFSKNNSAPKNILDMGCGSAILSMAAAKIYENAQIIGIDIDSEAIEVAKYNLQINNLPHINLYSGNGYQTKELQDNQSKTHKTFDLIFANILANPLIAMSQDLSQHLKPNGYAIISGFILDDSPTVQTAHHNHNLKTIKEFTNNDQWCSVILQKT